MEEKTTHQTILFSHDPLQERWKEINKENLYCARLLSSSGEYINIMWTTFKEWLDHFVKLLLLMKEAIERAFTFAFQGFMNLAESLNTSQFKKTLLDPPKINPPYVHNFVDNFSFDKNKLNIKGFPCPRLHLARSGC